jgi:hypothetical protein
MIPIHKKINSLIPNDLETKIKLSEATGVHINTVRNILSGRQTKNISLKVALGISNYLGITVEELVKDTEYEIK